MQLPIELLRSLEGVNGFDKDTFINIHESGEQVTSIRVSPYKVSNVKSETSNTNSFHVSRLTFHEKIPWTENGYYLASRPSFTFDPLFHAGCYYVQEASSMFLEQAIKQTVDLSQPLRVLDLCAAPGGKSTHLLSLISKESLLVSNEVIRSRANILNDNIVKWGCSNVIVTNNDPRDFQRLKNYFDVIVVDAPCSGSGLFRRDAEAIEEWSEQNVALCSHRQQRILADVLPALKNGGMLIYSTCSYSKQEDEEICIWLLNELKVKSEKLKVKNEWAVVESDNGYRFWPDKVKGEGFFIACFRKNDGDDEAVYLPKVKPEKFSSKEMEILNKNVNIDGLSFLRHEEIIYAVPEKLLADINFLSSKLRIVNCGTKVGEIIKDKLVPDHALALSNIVSDDISRLELDDEQAIKYLKKKELNLETDKKSWNLVTYLDHPLGWVNILPNRINNYYPKELRILKD
ncbi:MAG TPA: Fmu (Sun) domain protein [Chitinophagaceae bacterium]|nr:Fmu (Sun) domain protein [Chitinophagaceae bacterium]